MLYVVRRKLNISREEWDGLVWWEAELLLEGLMEEAEQNNKSGGGGGGTSRPAPIDLSSADADLSGFQTRRAG